MCNLWPVRLNREFGMLAIANQPLSAAFFASSHVLSSRKSSRSLSAGYDMLGALAYSASGYGPFPSRCGAFQMAMNTRQPPGAPAAHLDQGLENLLECYYNPSFEQGIALPGVIQILIRHDRAVSTRLHDGGLKDR